MWSRRTFVSRKPWCSATGRDGARGCCPRGLVGDRKPGHGALRWPLLPFVRGRCDHESQPALPQLWDPSCCPSTRQVIPVSLPGCQSCCRVKKQQNPRVSTAYSGRPKASTACSRVFPNLWRAISGHPDRRGGAHRGPRSRLFRPRRARWPAARRTTIRARSGASSAWLRAGPAPRGARSPCAGP